MKKQLIDYLPPVLQGVLEFQVLMGAQQTAFDAFYAGLWDTINDQFADSATEKGIARYESIFRITPKATDTLEERRFRIKCAMAERRPYTLAALKSQLETLCGAENVTVTLDATAQTLTVKVALIGKSNFESTERLVNKFVPCNLIANVILMYNTYDIVSAYTHNQLSARTYEQIRSEVF